MNAPARRGAGRSRDIFLADGDRSIRLESSGQDLLLDLRFNGPPMDSEQVQPVLAAAVVEVIERFPEHPAADSPPVHLGPDLHGFGVGVPRSTRQEGNGWCHEGNLRAGGGTAPLLEPPSTQR